MARRDVPLTRNTDDKKIAGVCSGLAEYFDLDTTLVRVVFVALLVFGGWSLVAYLLLWWLVDSKPPAPATTQATGMTVDGPRVSVDPGAA
jgi:phage shock protein C